MRVLLDTTVLSEPLRERPDPAVMAQLEHGSHALYTASVVLHELSYGIHRLAAGRRRERLNSYLQALLASGLTVLPYDCDAALWHGAQRAQLEARGQRPPFADGPGPPKSVSMACWRGLTALALVGGNGSPPCPKSLTQQLISLIPAI